MVNAWTAHGRIWSGSDRAGNTLGDRRLSLFANCPKHRGIVSANTFQYSTEGPYWLSDSLNSAQVMPRFAAVLGALTYHQFTKTLEFWSCCHYAQSICCVALKGQITEKRWRIA